MAQLINMSNAAEFSTMIGEHSCLIAFLATWSEPCRSQIDILSEFTHDHKDDLCIRSVNVDELSQVATMCNIQTLPTILFFVDGKELYRLVGLQQIKVLNQALKAIKDSRD